MTAALAVLAALVLVAGQVLVTDRLATAVAAQSRPADGKTVDDMVGTGTGFWLSVTLLALLTVANLAALAPASGRFARLARLAGGRRRRPPDGWRDSVGSWLPRRRSNGPAGSGTAWTGTSPRAGATIC